MFQLSMTLFTINLIGMQDIKGIMNEIKTQSELPLVVVSHKNNVIPQATLKKLQQAHRSTYFLFIFAIKGQFSRKVDLENINISAGQLFLVFPHQFYTASPLPLNMEYYALVFDQRCLSYISSQFNFLINPLNKQTIGFKKEEEKRIIHLFETLYSLLENRNSSRKIIQQYLTTLFSEIDHCYFEYNEQKLPKSFKLLKFMEFRNLVEKNLQNQLEITDIAEKLDISYNQLYRIVKEISSYSPKRYLINRCMLEVERRVHYSDLSIKQLAYEFGYRDPDYFSKLYKEYLSNRN